MDSLHIEAWEERIKRMVPTSYPDDLNSHMGGTAMLREPFQDLGGCCRGIQQRIDEKSSRQDGLEMLGELIGVHSQRLSSFGPSDQETIEESVRGSQVWKDADPKAKVHFDAGIQKARVVESIW